MAQTTLNSSKVVTPRPLKWYDRLAASIIYASIEVVSLTLRIRWDPENPLERLASAGKPVILCTWHNRLALSLVVYRRFLRRVEKGHHLAAIVSASKDGGIVARILEHFGVQPVRGSSSRRGPQALLELTSWAERGYDLAITPDGPRGPRYIVQPGVISLAQLTGLPVFPMSWYVHRKICAKSWDGFQVPLPFSSGIIRLGQSISVPREASEEQREGARLQLEEQLRKMTTD
jgi:lysophospholipid acyltransferase (LPLAT)-like uncharacterized protein